MATMAGSLSARHIQNMSEADILIPHFGYADRALPCVKDDKTCAYLDLVYSGHDYSMLFAGIFWAIVAAVLLAWAIANRVSVSRNPRDAFVASDQEAGASARPSWALRVERTVASTIRRYLLPDSIRLVFGRTTRLQVLILAIIAAYFIIASFAGLTYKIWVVPVPDHPGVNTIRTTLGPWSNRIGVMAYALTPLTVMLGTRESILSLVTGVPYQSFNFLHQWLGYIILAQALLHTIGWIVIETKLYAPQPQAALQLITEEYMIWGIVATLLILLLFFFSLPFVIRRTGYEFFRKAHYVLAMVYIGACYAHWKLLSCFLYPSLIIWGLDRAFRLFRSALLHYQGSADGGMGFRSVDASLAFFPDAEYGDIVRLDYDHPQEPWNIGQHFYLCFPQCSIWQSHPFTPLSHPVLKRDGTVRHSYIFRAKGGETKKVASLVQKKLANDPKATTPVIMSGCYGESTTVGMTKDVNVLCVAGGTGVTYVLPVLLDIVSKPVLNKSRKIQLVWAIRKKADVQWIQEELDIVRQAAATHGIQIDLFVTREPTPIMAEENVVDLDADSKEVALSPLVESPFTLDLSSAPSISSQDHNSQPDLPAIVSKFVQETVSGPTTVFASGPGGMISDLRSIVAKCNSGSQVWSGNERFDVSLVCDNRLE
jgi:predicted ferric reductase